MHSIIFPLLLAGPIIRRADKKQVYIWLALSENYRIDANMFHVDSASQLQTETITECVQLGKHLFIYLVKITPLYEDFPTDTLIGYNLHFFQGSKHHDLGSLGLLTPGKHEAIVYGQLKYPTFHIKSDDEKTSLLYGSCRKLHGNGEDILTKADSFISANCDNTTKRPASLFLMGDQIYADDVADPLIRIISTLAKSLIGREEDLYHIEPRLSLEPFRTSINQINGRQYLMNTLCHFTSTKSHNHLIQLGEYAALYLLSWSPVLWEVAQEQHLFDSFDHLFEKNEIHLAFSDEIHDSKEHDLEKRNLKARYTEQQESLIPIQQSLYRVRRLLANISTYMLFDDHDITDDWNLSLEWKQKVYHSPLGKHVIANGLSAYWAFQGWGNQPEAFDSHFLKIMNRYFYGLRSGKMSATHDDWADLLWRFNGWHFVSATTPKALFLDTRTQREYELEPHPVKFIKLIKEAPPPPILLNHNAWNMASTLLHNSGWKEGNPLIIVSPPPVYGLGLIETFLHDYVYPLRVLGIDIQNRIDFEAWKYNGKGFTEFLFHVAKWHPSKCVILSGDVHYASSVDSIVTFKEGVDLKINQYTSSPIKNMSFSGIGGLLMNIAMFVNSLKRKNKEIQRYCDTSYHILQNDKNIIPGSIIWSDTLRYRAFTNGSLIETDNNLGLLTLSSESIENTLLKK
jgi:hypothetical protein